MSKHIAPRARRLTALSLFVLASASPALAEVRLHPLTAVPTPVVSKPAPSTAAVMQEIAIRDMAERGVLGCVRSGNRMVC